jgi:hypothetical protein
MIFLLFLSVNTFAVTFDEYLLLSRSTTGRTAVLNYGSLDGAKDNDEITILQKFIAKDKKIKIRIIARARSVKILNSKSVWFLFKLYDRDNFKKNKKFIVASKSSLLAGRFSKTTTRMEIVASDPKGKKTLKDFYYGLDQKKLVFNGSNFEKSNHAHDNKRKLSEDFMFVDVSKWKKVPKQYFDKVHKKFGTKKELVVGEYYRSPYENDFLRKKDLDTYEKIVVSYLKKINDPEFSIDDLYLEQMKDSTGELSVESNKRDLYSQYMAENNSIKKKNKKFYIELLAKNKAWSDEFSDKDLERLIVERGVLDEQVRRLQMIARKYQWSASIFAGINTLNNESAVDSINTQAVKYDLGASIEYFFALRFPKFHRFSIEVEFRRGQDGYEVGSGLNATSTDFSFAGTINWYPAALPSSIEHNILFVGAGLRFGQAKLTVTSLGEEGLYAILGFPVIRAGIRYNFMNGWGLKFLSSFESFSLSRIQRNIVGELPEAASGQEFRLRGAVTYFF